MAVLHKRSCCVVVNEIKMLELANMCDYAVQAVQWKADY